MNSMNERIVEKLGLYDLFGNLIPGIVAVSLLGAAWYWTGHKVELPNLSQAVSVLVLSALAIVLGQFVQAIGSLLQKFYFWTWGGRPSDRAMKRLLPSQSAALRTRLANYMLEDASDEVTDHQIFLWAFSVCNYKSLGRVERFNSIYAYNRALTTLMLISTIATLGIIFVAEPNPPAAWTVLGIEVLITLLFWYRTRQRGIYFADEVLRMADLEIGRVP
jgi:hypothetical protein